MSDFKKLLNKVDLYEKLAVYGSRSAFLAKLAQDAGVPGAPTPGNASYQDTPPADWAPAASKYPAIAKDVQVGLDAFLQACKADPAKPSANCDVDGSRGPQTEAALKYFTNTLKLTGKPESEVFALAKACGELYGRQGLVGAEKWADEQLKLLGTSAVDGVLKSQTPVDVSTFPGYTAPRAGTTDTNERPKRPIDTQYPT
jgi:hypothetical protein